MAIKDIRDDNFEAEILGSGPSLALVDFWANWCAPCKALTPIIEQLSEKYAGQVSFAKLNVEENPRIPSRYQVFSIPNLILFKDGQVYAQLVGSAKPKEIESLILSGLKYNT